MARQLKTFVTSVGFFDLAVAAPSMKAALDAWGFRHNAFQQGFASQSQDAGIIAATTAQPGVVLRRPVGTNQAFTVDAELPRGFTIPKVGKVARQTVRPATPAPARPKRAKPVEGKKGSRAAIISFAKEKKKRDRLRAREEAQAKRKSAKREGAVEKAQSALAAAEAQHRKSLEGLERARAAIDHRMAQEQQKWDKRRAALEASLDRARKR